MVKDLLKPFCFLLNCMGIYGFLWEFVGFFVVLLDLLELFRIAWESLVGGGLFGSFGILWNSSEFLCILLDSMYGTLWEFVGFFGLLLDSVGLFETALDSMGTNGNCGLFVVLLEDIGALLGLFLFYGNLWEIVGLFVVFLDVFGALLDFLGSFGTLIWFILHFMGVCQIL